MGHAGEPQVLHKGDAAGDLARNVEPLDRLADDFVSGGRLRPRLRVDLAVEIGVAGELAVAHLAAVRRADHAVGDRELCCIDAEALRREIEQNFADLGTGEPQRHAAIFDRLAAGGDTLVRRLLGVAGDQVEARQRQLELLRRDLGERGRHALAELDLAGAHRRRAVGMDADPGVEHPVLGEAAGEFRRLLGERRRDVEAREKREGDDDAAEAGRDLAAGEHIHVRSSPFRGTPAGRRG